MAKKDKMQTLADDLEQILDQKEDAEASFAEVLDPIKEREAEIRAALLETMQKKGWKSAKATSGLGFVITKGRKTFSIKKGMEELAMKWALKEYPAILSISTAKLADVVQPMIKGVPEFVVEKVGNPFLTVKQTESDDE